MLTLTLVSFKKSNESFIANRVDRRGAGGRGGGKVVILFLQLYTMYTDRQKYPASSSFESFLMKRRSWLQMIFFSEKQKKKKKKLKFMKMQMYCD